MKWSLYIGKPFGIKLFIHWTFLFIIGWVIFNGYRAGLDFTGISWSVLFMLTIFLCVVLHELGHAVTAQRFNIKTRDIVLLPIGGMARMEKLPEKPSQELIVAIAGPIVNFVIAAIIYFSLQINGSTFDVSEFAQISGKNFFLLLLMVNITLAVFNLIPAFPMDGGRILRALLSFKLPHYTSTRIAAATGQIIAVLFIISGFFYNPFLILIGAFLFLGAQAELEYSRAKSVLSGYKVKDVLMTNFKTIDSNEPVSNAVKLLLDSQQKDFVVTDGNSVAGTISGNDMLKAITETGDKTPVKSAMQSNIVYLKEETPLEDALKMQKEKSALMLVMENSHVKGVVDFENIMEFLLVKEALKKPKYNAD